MAEWKIEAVGAEATARAFTVGGTTMGSQALGVTRTFGRLVETAAKANASGRPGPRAVTGDYRRSINTQVGATATEVWAEIGTNKPQGRRLELGFRGVDSLGRRYNNPPLPHFGPALDRYDDAYELAIASLVDGI